ncbi:ribonuclease R [Mycoplasmoides genitalium]
MKVLTELQKQIFTIVKKENGKPIPPGIVVRMMENSPNFPGKHLIYRAIDDLLDWAILRKAGGVTNQLLVNYEPAEPLLDKKLQGILTLGNKNSGFIRSLDDDKTVYYVHYSNLTGALDGDLVEFCKLDKPQFGDKFDAAVITILKRARILYAGNFLVDQNEFALEYKIVADNPRFYLTMIVNPDSIPNNLASNTKIAFQIDEYDPDNNLCKVSVQQVLGNNDDPLINIKAIMLDNSIVFETNDVVEQHANKLSFDTEEQHKAYRQDLTDLAFVTVDPTTSKDLDDAIYVKTIPTGFVLYVAIADVAHYVNRNSEIDIEAKHKTSSIYLPGHYVVPMLPEQLSNQLCSLNPAQKRYVVVCEISFDNQGRIKTNKLYPATIISKNRFSYDQVNKWLNNKSKLNCDETVINSLKAAFTLSDLIQAQRQKRGTIDLSHKETEIVVDEHYFPIKINFLVHDKAETMIENLMVVANETVAWVLTNNKIALPYRVHPRPSKKKLQSLIETVGELSITKPQFNLDTVTSSQIASWLNENKDNPSYEIFVILLLRTLGKAFYSVNPLMHFSIGSNHYTHFTSPIRRYIDLTIHRLLWMHLFTPDQFTDNERDQLKQELEKIADTVNDTEIKIINCERNANDYLTTLLLSKQIGKTFSGFISAITSFGIFMRMDENNFDGLIKITTIPDDFFIFEKEKMVLKGRKTNKVYKIGDRLEAKLSEIDFIQKRAILTLI